MVYRRPKKRCMDVLNKDMKVGAVRDRGQEEGWMGPTGRKDPSLHFKCYILCLLTLTN